MDLKFKHSKQERVETAKAWKISVNCQGNFCFFKYFCFNVISSKIIFFCMIWYLAYKLHIERKIYRKNDL